MLGKIGHVIGWKVLEESVEPIENVFLRKSFSLRKLIVCFFYLKDYHPDRQDIQKSMTAFKNLSVSN